MAMAYLDDIIVFALSFEEHLQWLQKVMQKLKGAVAKTITLLRKRSIAWGTLSLRRVSSLIQPRFKLFLHLYPPPKDAKQLRQFLGFANYYRRYVKNYSQIAEPLHKLTRKSRVSVEPRVPGSI